MHSPDLISSLLRHMPCWVLDPNLNPIYMLFELVCSIESRKQYCLCKLDWRIGWMRSQFLIILIYKTIYSILAQMYSDPEMKKKGIKFNNFSYKLLFNTIQG